MTTSWPNNTSLADLDFPVDDQTDAGSEFLAGPVRDRPIRTWTWTPTGAATNEILIAVHRDLCLCKTIEERRHCYQLARRFFTPVSTMPQCLYLVLFDVYEHLPAVYEERGHWSMPSVRSEPDVTLFDPPNSCHPHKFIDNDGEVKEKPLPAYVSMMHH